MATSETVREFIEKYLSGEKTTENTEFQFKDETAKQKWSEDVATRTSADDKEIIAYVQDWAKIMSIGMREFGFTVAQMSAVIANKELLESRQFDTAVALLHDYWAHGDEVSRWYDTMFQGK